MGRQHPEPCYGSVPYCRTRSVLHSGFATVKNLVASNLTACSFCGRMQKQKEPSPTSLGATKRGTSDRATPPTSNDTRTHSCLYGVSFMSQPGFATSQLLFSKLVACGN
jgi:hypothetical protein